MKFNYFTLLTIILSSLLSVLSTPVISNDEIINQDDLNKRGLLCGVIYTPKYTKDEWHCCDFNCQNEDSWACRSDCITYQADTQRAGGCRNCKNNRGNTRKDGRCGKGYNNAHCHTGYCCSQYGYCGKTKDHCGKGCQGSFGKCS